jgi:hypothetical protein
MGAGGMGEVYRARDAKLNRDVALKILSGTFVNDPNRLARFRREAQVLASLSHPNIAAIYGFEDSGATHALVLELVEGPTLADRKWVGFFSQGQLQKAEVAGGAPVRLVEAAYPFGATWTEDLLREAIDRSSFTSLQRAEKARKPSAGGHGLFFRSGSAGLGPTAIPIGEL